jgi:hypothetical protein
MWAPLTRSLPSFPLFVPMPQKYSFKAANTTVCVVLIKRNFFSYNKSNKPVWHFVHKQKAINLILDIFLKFPKPINLILDSFQNFPKPHHKRSGFFRFLQPCISKHDKSSRFVNPKFHNPALERNESKLLNFHVIDIEPEVEMLQKETSPKPAWRNLHWFQLEICNMRIFLKWEKKEKKKKKKQLPITRLRININPIFITSRTASWTQFSASATSSRGIEHCSYTSSINQAARWNKWWARTNSTTAAATNSSVAPQNYSHTWCVQTSKSSGGGRKKNHSLKKSSDRSWSFKHLLLGIINQFYEQLSN